MSVMLCIVWTGTMLPAELGVKAALSWVPDPSLCWGALQWSALRMIMSSLWACLSEDEAKTCPQSYSQRILCLSTPSGTPPHPHPKKTNERPVTDVVYGWSWRQQALLTVQRHISFHAHREGATKWHQRTQANKGGSERRGENKEVTKSNMHAL